MISSPPPQAKMDSKEKVTAGLNQKMRDLEHLLQAVHLQTNTEQEGG